MHFVHEIALPHLLVTPAQLGNDQNAPCKVDDFAKHLHLCPEQITNADNIDQQPFNSPLKAGTMAIVMGMN